MLPVKHVYKRVFNCETSGKMKELSTEKAKKIVKIPIQWLVILDFLTLKRLSHVSSYEQWDPKKWKLIFQCDYLYG